MKHRSYPTLAAAAGLALVLSACGSGGTSSGPGGGDPLIDGTFRFALEADPGALNPVMTASSATGEISRLAYDSLVYQDPDTSKVGPWLAEKWDETPTSASFTIREGVTCTDGSTLTPQTVADNINFVANPDNGSRLRGSVVPTGASATADPATRTVTVNTATPSPFLLLNVGRLPILCEAGVKDPTASNKASLGTGMFQVTEIAAGSHYTFERREGYNWGPDGTTSDTPGVPKTVIASVAPNVSTSANQLLSGELHAAPIDGPDKSRIEAANFTSIKRPMSAGQMYFNQTATNPTSDPAVRTALIQAVNLDDLAQVVTAGNGIRATSLVAVEPRACVYDSVTANLPEFDLSAAQATLDAAGWTANVDGKRSKDGKPLNLRLVYDGVDDPRNAAAELAQSAWTQLGANVEVTGGDENRIIDIILSGKDNTAWDIAWIQINSSLPSTFTGYFSGPVPAAGKNFSSISNPAYDAAVTKASGLTGEAACDAWADAESEIVKSASAVTFADAITNLYFNKAGLSFGKTLNGSALRLYQ
ncbi:ABC transporter substrate-binding protein [Rhodococcus erythropolis]|uniref:ABC transporter substrate-binding protein n=1 Tax=Rhodococcus TaxID=1827 RepID=UPI000DC020E5|nr:MULTISPECIES: ABC transporter substrate-binding protein [unclassified Rhodococcus (in: high G+C Gram-positive bacteria)]MCD2154326.1 ABC transporter substrate-binding protein [Rhodococcus cerastii]MDI9907600.1 ABC transporter substrate-binding protein [Rhodococcus sp. IEGM 1406]RAL35691.1 ABC transporter substrate-binding protein [Rhodococcus sp. AQ5-07]